ncbi:hypothetical protein OEA41_002975 [Lepraria neglecta]|uniref:NFACT RNA-binding domain-containing protein n=1 Tax=Lepraria neglecta TaxID=209136 RepID=A0AAE0DIK1_9LECA|nr:hypothetical protein OEA41_002975 [Lepraria neglecta]
MVYYFKSNVTNPPAIIYVGKDKFENEELIKFGWDCDFHVDNLSSAHIYVRLSPEQKWDSLPAALVEDCAQLTKANSIEGNKKDNVTIIYTPWSNLLKNSSMATGQVSFHDQKKTKKILVTTRTNSIINRLEKTRTVSSPDELPAAKEVYLASQRAEKRREAEKKKKEEEKVMRERREEKEKRERGYGELMQGEGRSNEEGFDEDDFM